ncbi:hypothetical protein WKY82_09020 [Gordonia malaquae]|uniref:hypothetical protein n=1 Tax=Gordonia malaquae TaxID=410332 RepID=UPI0030C79FB3
MTRSIGMPLREAADEVGFSVDTLRREWLDGKLDLKQFGGRYYVSRDELTRWFTCLEPAVPGSKRRPA